MFKFPDMHQEFASFVTKEDFVANKPHRIIFQVMVSIIDKSETIDEVIVAERIKDLGISFEEDIDIFTYIQSLSMRQITPDKFRQVAKELCKVTVSRKLAENLDNAKDFILSCDPSESISNIIHGVDKIYSKEIQVLDGGPDKPKNIFDDLEQFVEERGENPIEEFGIMGPHERINQLYGSLLRAGNICVIVARTKAGKTAFSLDYCTKVGASSKVPILHFDDGEMSYRELQIRQCSALSGVSPYYIETGKWRQNSSMEKAVRSVWPKMKGMNFHYYNVGGLSAEEMVNSARRFYYSEVGRGNKMVLSFDYLKFRSQDAKSGDSWYVMGHMLDCFKQFIQKEVVYEGEPQISMLTSVQANRQGIARNGEIEDNESIVGLSDMLGQLCSHLFILRQKTIEELAEDGSRFGTHKFINILSRHLGKDVGRALNPVVMPDGSKKKNYVNFEFKNFHVKEIGDLVDWTRELNVHDAEPVS